MVASPSFPSSDRARKAVCPIASDIDRTVSINRVATASFNATVKFQQESTYLASQKAENFNYEAPSPAHLQLQANTLHSEYESDDGDNIDIARQLARAALDCRGFLLLWSDRTRLMAMLTSCLKKPNKSS
jgi:hypothetical protein